MGRKLKQRLLAGELNAIELVEHQWFSFKDNNGQGCCQTDYYLICEGFIILLECKLTQSADAENQMNKLYKPILEQVYQMPVICVQVCKRLRHHPDCSIWDITRLLDTPRAGTFTWHWLGG